jgi:hypothetical protein
MTLDIQIRNLATAIGSDISYLYDKVNTPVSANPVAGPSKVTLQRDVSGVLTGLAFVQDSINGTVSVTRDGQSMIATIATSFDGKTRTEVVTRDGYGNISEINATLT